MFMVFFFKYKDLVFMCLVCLIVFIYFFGLVSLWKLIFGYWILYFLLNVGVLKNICKVICDRKLIFIDCEELLLCEFFLIIK